MIPQEDAAHAIEILKPYLFTECLSEEFRGAVALGLEALEAQVEASKAWGKSGHSTKWCPVCWTDLTTLDTRATVTGLLRRRRYCPKCDKRFWTLELLEEDAPEEARRH